MKNSSGRVRVAKKKFGSGRVAGTRQSLLISRMLKARYELGFKAKILSGGKRFKRTKKKVEFELTDEDMKYLKENTRYDEEEIREWFRWDRMFKI